MRAAGAVARSAGASPPASAGLAGSPARRQDSEGPATTSAGVFLFGQALGRATGAFRSSGSCPCSARAL